MKTTKLTVFSGSTAVNFSSQGQRSKVNGQGQIWPLVFDLL